MFISLGRPAHPDGTYPTGIKISDKAMKALPLTRHETHGQWNYTLTPPPTRPADLESR
jgi:hypothetical protein